MQHLSNLLGLSGLCHSVNFSGIGRIGCSIASRIFSAVQSIFITYRSDAAPTESLTGRNINLIQAGGAPTPKLSDEEQRNARIEQALNDLVKKTGQIGKWVGRIEELQAFSKKIEEKKRRTMNRVNFKREFPRF